ncbi:Predicted kinase, aminoglycoside phosphotransferase (APT) family [Azospirillum oryzae]|uniref:Predicted kinase, aminoglycoside phosphotransferase (APT) family n=1 Tax=Azospirillum oryzae TaxID=286727 RepID=A0A1X7DJV3_9PROT|nr:phosphotransferase family protein [Azospirillum oryzae]SMF16729.1 Predicted kinase, aminoglycoside phosphotransferase (APT) family [Azospirillum oryzae]
MSGAPKPTPGLDPARKAALESWLAGQAEARAVAVIDEGRLSGGAISLNLAVTLEIDGGPLAGNHPCVLRTGSASGVSASLGKAEEAAVLRAVFAVGATVPEPLFVGADPAMLGAPFYIMRRAAGIAAGFRMVKSEEPRRDLARELGRQLGLIHRVRPGAEGLEFLALPEPTAALQAAADFRRWAGRYAASDPVLAYGLRWLERNAPPAGDLVLCHRDYRTGNYMVDGDRLTAIIDWEFAGWSDPMEDLGWFCAACWRFGRNDREAGGIADRTDLYAGYEETAGRRVDADAVAYWEAAACMRWAVIAIQQAQRHISGTEPSLELALTGRMLPEIEMDLLRHLDRVGGFPMFGGGA